MVSPEKMMLIVDDLEVNRTILRSMFAHDYYVLEAENGERALAILEEFAEKIDIVLLDIIMPGINGFDVLKAIQAKPELANLPVVTVTQYSENEIKALEFGAWDFINKPFDPAVVKTRVENVVSRRFLTQLLNEKATLAVREEMQNRQLALLKEKLRSQRRLEYLSKFDELTGIYCKSNLYRQIAAVLQAKEEEPFYLVSLDVVRFKVINELFGTAAGDDFLCYIANNLKLLLADKKLCLYGRLDADVFGFSFTGSQEELLSLLQQLDKIIAGYQNSIEIIAAYGIYRVTNHSMEVSLMFDRANLALQTVKGKYFGNYAFYNDAMQEDMLLEQKIVGQMVTALAKGQFVIYLQPKYNLVEGTILGAEALVRWEHPTEGLIEPDEFIPVFERNGFIMKMDEYVWELTCKLLSKWREESKKLFPISVNVSRVNLYNPHFCEILINLVEKYKLPPTLLELEITESAYTENAKVLQEAMVRLQNYGFRILMDDFGSGYSSLNMLKELPVDILKIDLHFLVSDGFDGRGGNILASVIRMAKWLKLPVICEGVETKEQVKFLDTLGCNIAQGFYFAKPMPVESFERLWQEGNKDAIVQFANFHSMNSKVELEALWNPNGQLSLLFNSISSAVGIFELQDDKLEVVRLNEGYFKLVNIANRDIFYDTEKMIAAVCEEDRGLIMQMYREAKANRNISEAEYRRTLPDGRKLWLHAKTSYIANIDDRYLFYTAIDDITARKESEIFWRKKAELDALTGLLNREALESRIDQHLVAGGQGTFFMMDIDNFKQVNDQKGHAFGDFTLKNIAEVLKKYFVSEAFIGRIGGDEFVVFTCGGENLKQIGQDAQNICDIINHIFKAEDGLEKVSSSIGVAFAPKDGDTFEKLYLNSDAAQYLAKRSGKNRYAVYGEEYHATQKAWVTSAEWILDEVDSSVYICDVETHELLYLNEPLLKNLGKSYNECIGKPCYEVLMNYGQPCCFCVMKELPENVYKMRYYHNEKNKEDYLLRGKLLTCQGKKVHLEIAINLTKYLPFVDSKRLEEYLSFVNQKV